MTRRLYTASEIRRYGRCPRQWWYEENMDEGSLSRQEIERRMAALRRHHGEAVHDQPDYRLLHSLLSRDDSLARGRVAHRRHAARVRGRSSGCLLHGTLLLLSLLLVVHHATRHR